MSNQPKVELKGGELIVEGHNLLASVRTEQVISVSPFQIRTHIGLESLELDNTGEQKVLRAVQEVAKKYTKELVDEVEKLAREVKEFVKKDAAGDAAAGGKAKAAVDKTNEELDEKLVEFGKLMRKAVEKGVGKKLTSTNKSVSTGGFKGIKLSAKFSASGNGMDVDVDDEVKKWLVKNNEEILLQKVKAAIEKDGTDADMVKKVRDKIYEIRCARSTNHFIVALAQGDRFAMQAIYEAPTGGGKQLVAGEAVSGYAV